MFSTEMPPPIARPPQRRDTAPRPISLEPNAPGHLQFDNFDIGFDHHCHQFVKTDGVPPAELLPRFRRIADEMIDLGWPNVTRINLHQDTSSGGIDARLAHAAPAPCYLNADLAKGELDKLSHRMRLTGTKDKVVRLRLLENAPHALHIVARVSPISFRVEVSEVEFILQP